MLELRNVSGKNFRRNSKKFNLKNINFCAPKGFITGITGVNGAGKTTLFHYIVDEKVNYDGEILYDGRNIREDFNDFKNKMAYISDEYAFFQDLSIADNVRMLSLFFEKWDNDVFLKYVKMMEIPVGRKMSALSRGQFLKFQMAFAMAHGAKLYLLDEATAGMDPVFRKDFFDLLHELIAKEDITIIMSSHIEEEINIHMDYVGIIEDGRLVSFEEVEEM